jgi:hypothetical protein
LTRYPHSTQYSLYLLPHKLHHHPYRGSAHAGSMEDVRQEPQDPGSIGVQYSTIIVVRCVAQIQGTVKPRIQEDTVINGWRGSRTLEYMKNS